MSSKTKLYQIATLLSLWLPALALSQEASIYQVSVRRNFADPSSSLNGLLKDDQIRWFDDARQASSWGAIELALVRPTSDVDWGYRYQSFRGSHFGQAGKYVCLRFLCSWVPGSIVSDLPTTDRASFDIQSHQAWAAYRFHVADTGTTLAPLGGINVVDGRISIGNSTASVSRSGAFPVPFYGVRLEQAVWGGVQLKLETHYSNFSKGSYAYLLRDTQLEAAMPLGNGYRLAIGRQDYTTRLTYDTSSEAGGLDLRHRGPYVKLTYSF